MSDGSQPESDLYSHGGMIAFIFSMVFVTVFILYIVFMHPGVNLGEIPDPSGKTVTQEVKTTFVDPWKTTPELIEHGSKLFQTNCALCHGPKGIGDGPAGASLNPKPRNLIEGKWKVGGDSISLYTTLTKGIAGSSMPGFAHFKSEDRWAMVHWVRSITNDKVPDDLVKLEEFAKTAK